MVLIVAVIYPNHVNAFGVVAESVVDDVIVIIGVAIVGVDDAMIFADDTMAFVDTINPMVVLRFVV